MQRWVTGAATLGLLAAAASTPAKSPLEVRGPDRASSCAGDFGTRIEFMSSPAEAAAWAKKEGKLVLVLHVSGHFEDPQFTWNNAEALRVNALANPEVGKFVNEYFESSFQKVATFKIVNGQKQGGNVATYFCAPDGRVLHCVAGPVDAATMLQEAKWVVETARQAIDQAKGDGAAFKAIMRQAHAERLRSVYGLVVEPVTFDPPEEQGENDALTYRDPSGRPLAPKLPPPPVDGPDVRLGEAEFLRRQVNEAKAQGAAPIACRGGRRGLVLGNQGRVHQVMAAHAMVKIEKVYGTVFENILGEKISTRPVEVLSPFSWVNAKGERLATK